VKFAVFDGVRECHFHFMDVIRRAAELQCCFVEADRCLARFHDALLVWLVVASIMN
jgi:hypothetical protein